MSGAFSVLPLCALDNSKLKSCYQMLNEELFACRTKIRSQFNELRTFHWWLDEANVVTNIGNRYRDLES